MESPRIETQLKPGQVNDICRWCFERVTGFLLRRGVVIANGRTHWFGYTPRKGTTQRTGGAGRVTTIKETDRMRQLRKIIGERLRFGALQKKMAVQPSRCSRALSKTILTSAMTPISWQRGSAIALNRLRRA
jgi:hypothetical protein